LDGSGTDCGADAWCGGGQGFGGGGFGRLLSVLGLVNGLLQSLGGVGRHGAVLVGLGGCLVQGVGHILGRVSGGLAGVSGVLGGLLGLLSLLQRPAQRRTLRDDGHRGGVGVPSCFPPQLGELGAGEHRGGPFTTFVTIRPSHNRTTARANLDTISSQRRNPCLARS